MAARRRDARSRARVCARAAGLCAALLGLGWLEPLRAAQTAGTLAFAAPQNQSLPGPAGGVLRVALALLVVLGAVFAAAWLSRRMHGVGAARGSALQLIAQLPLGPRERAILIRVGNQQLLLGVANGSVRALHVLAAPAGGDPVAAPDSPRPDGAPPARPTFKAMLLKSLGR